MYLALKTHESEASISLISDEKTLSSRSWEAQRTLSDTLLKTIEELLNEQNKVWSDINGIFIYKGPGSFTGLRIGITVANTLANGLSVPIVGVQGDDWLEDGIQKLDAGLNDEIVVPEYGGEANITKPRK